jgi:hypothetical protein
VDIIERGGIKIAENIVENKEINHREFLRRNNAFWLVRESTLIG